MIAVQKDITPAQIDHWRNAPSETQGLEFKEAKTGHDWVKTLEYCVAIANEGGGHLVFGVTDKRPRQVVGTAACGNPMKFAHDLFQALSFRVDVLEVAHPDGRVVVLVIPSRPKGTPLQYKGTYFMRVGESLTGMTPEALRVIFAEGGPSWLDEHSKTDLDAAQVVDLLDTQAFFDLMKSPYPTNQLGVIERLLAERLIEQKNGTLCIKRMAAVLLAKRLTDFPDVSRKAARVIVYKGNNKLETKIEPVVGSGGYASRFRDLVNFVMGQLPQNEVIKDALRVSVTLAA